MSRKEQVTLTLDPFILKKLRDIAEERDVSLSSVIEEHLLAKSRLGETSDTSQLLTLLTEIQQSLGADKDKP